MIEAGSQAPAFTLADQTGRKLALADLLAESRVMLAFYPADFSPQCGDQFSQYEPGLADVEAHDARIVGVSVDSSWSHKAFQTGLGTTITLLSDFNPKGEVCRAYGAYIDERGHANRSLVLIERDGTVSWVHESPTPLEIPSLDLILGALA